MRLCSAVQPHESEKDEDEREVCEGRSLGIHVRECRATVTGEAVVDEGASGIMCAVESLSVVLKGKLWVLKVL